MLHILHRFLWGIAALPLGVYAITQDLNVPLIVQPQLLGLFSLLSWCQCMYYGGARRSRTWCVVVLGTTLVLWAALEVALIFALRPSYRRGTVAGKDGVRFFGILSTTLISISFIPQFYEIYKHRAVIGISLAFMAIDLLGGLSSILSLVFKHQVDVLAAVAYGIVTVRPAAATACLYYCRVTFLADEYFRPPACVMDGLVIVLAMILNPRAMRGAVHGEQWSRDGVGDGGDGDGDTVTAVIPVTQTQEKVLVRKKEATSGGNLKEVCHDDSTRVRAALCLPLPLKASKRSSLTLYARASVTCPGADAALLVFLTLPGLVLLLSAALPEWLLVRLELRACVEALLRVMALAALRIEGARVYVRIDVIDAVIFVRGAGNSEKEYFTKAISERVDGNVTSSAGPITVDLLSMLALATKQIQQGRPKKFVKKLCGEKDVEARLQRLDRLMQEEARTATAQTLEVVHGFVQNMRVVMDDGKASVDMTVSGMLSVFLVGDNNSILCLT
ncbi:hypothetical protein BJV74DRAFT_798724 [Russula compacta]|nr:hypothetical protein BJV74DRAFT_798724 [Russula compacta]